MPLQIEGFIQANPNSPWTPGLHLQAGDWRRSRLKLSAAQAQYAAAWQLTNEHQEDRVREMATHMAAKRRVGEILAESGNFEAMNALEAEAESLRFGFTCR